MGLLLTPSTDMRSQIRSGLLDRGLAPHVADAFIMNFQDESGLNPGINEIAPLVPGSRGGFGLYQLTGPRRRAYEAFAQERGAPLDSVDAQLDFMMTELQGPESRAAQAIFAAPDTGTAAAAIVNKFLRPAEEHRARRAARYTGGQQVMSTNSPAQSQGLLSAPQTEAPMQPERAGGLLGSLFPDMTADRRDEIKLALNGMLHNPNQGMQRAIENRMANRREDGQRTQAAQQAQQQANRTAQWLASQPGGQQYAQAIASGALPAGEALTMWRAASQGQEPTALMQNVEYIRQQNPGLSMQDALQMAKSGTTVNVNSQAPSPATGYRNVFDDQGRLVAQEPIPGGPVATEMEQAAQAQAQASQAQATNETTTENVVLNQTKAIREMLTTGGMFDLPEAGIVGNTLGRMGINQEAVNMRNRLATLEGMVSFDQLAKMREASPTGGALGAISERELTLLSAQLGTLDQSSDPQTIMETLDLLESVMRKADAYPNAGQFGFGGTSQAAPKVKTYNPQTGRLE